MASNTTYRAAQRIRPLHLLLSGSVCLLLTLLHFAANDQQALVRAVKITENPVYTQELEVMKPKPLRERFAVSLSENDIDTYHAIFAAQAASDWETADTLIAKLNDATLLGSLLADRYLSVDYISYYDELETWMRNYADHPKAHRIHSLAKRKQPNDSEMLAHASSTGKRLKGFGTANGIGGVERPTGWRAALAHLRNDRFAQAESAFVKIAKRVDHSWYKSAGYYWAARAATATDQNEKARNYYNKASQQGYTLYGVLAASALQQPILHAPYNADANHSIYDLASIARASVYKQLNMDARAEHELRNAYTQTDRAGQEQLLHISAALELPALQLRISQALWYNTKLHHTGDYPLPSWELAERSAKAPNSLLYAIARQESGFYTKAKSRVGATGVMQIMPETARYIIDKNGLDEVRVASADGSFPKSSFTLANLTKPEINLAVGAHYIDYLAEKHYIDNSVIHILAAYNAGPGALRKWTKEYSHIQDPLHFVEHIPYRETRHYVQQVLTNYIMYEMLEGQSSKAISDLHASTWPTVNQ